jgi:NAD(P)-dependent dehydrogenase (short-subunit alcohol dehydrogenase family)
MAHVMIQGASRGVGLEMARQCLERGDRVFATCRAPERAEALLALVDAYPAHLTCVALDLSAPESIQQACETVGRFVDRLHLVVNVAGLLHAEGVAPEKKLEHLEWDAMQAVFAVNTFGPAMVMRYVKPLLQHRERAVLASVSARVGSITDNRLGGWYAYRASKAAQNMFTRTAAIELGRGSRRAIVVALHPGTVETTLSAPFRGGVPADKLFTPEQAARQLLSVLDGLDEASSGKFFAWDGSEIPW